MHDHRVAQVMKTGDHSPFWRLQPGSADHVDKQQGDDLLCIAGVAPLVTEQGGVLILRCTGLLPRIEISPRRKCNANARSRNLRPKAGLFWS